MKKPVVVDDQKIVLSIPKVMRRETKVDANHPSSIEIHDGDTSLTMQRASQES
jgi:hypothetical protein